MSARKCGKRHRDVVSFMSGEGAILRCRWCHEVVPWGPANDTAESELESLAALAATTEPNFDRYLLAISLHMAARGWPGVQFGDRGEWAEQCEDLALTIRTHDQ